MGVTPDAPRPDHRRWRLDGSYRRPAGGDVVIAGSPLTLFRLSPAGRVVIEALERGHPLPSPSAGLTDRLVATGAIHPVAAQDPVDPRRLTVVVPAFGEQPIYRPTRCRCVAVDDASPVPLVVSDPLVTLHRRDRNGGPAAARNVGLADVTTPYVAFVDSDVTVHDDDLLRLATHLDDPAVALVAPRVTALASSGAPGRGALVRFEQRHSPLDMGSEPARIAPATRVSYVPAAVLVCRTDAIREIGGFDESLRYGEDVDLVWRLVAAGWRCRYEPAVAAGHRTRTTMPAWLAQRYRYGTSAAPLAQRHPGALAPVRMSGWSAAAWAPVVMGLPLVGVTIAAASSAMLVRRLPQVPPRESLRIAGLGNLFAGRQLACSLTRTWWPLAVGGALVSRRMRRVLLAAAFVPAALDWRRDRPPLDLVRSLALRLLDDVAYGAGVWRGAIRHRRVDVLLPAFSPWPPRERARDISRAE